MATATEAQTQHALAPNITVLTRVVSIPIISSSLGAIDGALSSNTYTRFSYNHAKGLSTTAYSLTEPIQAKLAPLLVRADSYANMAVDALELRYPYPFKVRPEDAMNYVNKRVSDITKAINEEANGSAYMDTQDVRRQRTSEIATSISAIALLVSPLNFAQNHVYSLWINMFAMLKNLRALNTSLEASLNSYADLSSTANKITFIIIAEDLYFQDKIALIIREVWNM